MNAAALHAFLLAGVLAVVVELASGKLFGRTKSRGRNPRPTFAVSALLALAVMAGLGAGNYQPLAPGPSLGLYGVMAGVLALFAAGLRTDYAQPSSRRHFQGTIIGGVFLSLCGLGASYVAVPGTGNIALGALFGLLFTLVWVFVVVGLMEILSLVPLLTGAICLVIAGLSIFSTGVYESFPGQVIGGVLGGAILGTFMAELLRGQTRAATKADSLVAGFLVATATMTLFIKSMTLAGLILPLGLATVVVMVVLVQSFDRTLILRASPRE